MKDSISRPKAGLAVLSAALAVLLTACGSNGSPTPDQNSNGKPSASPTATVNSAYIAPGDELAVFDEDQETAEVKPAPTPSTAQEQERSENPEKPVGTTSSNAELPKGTQLPDSADVLENASRLDGYNSFVAMAFALPWESAVDELRDSMEAAGWECYECIPFVPGPNAPKETENFRYFLNMQKDGHRVMTVIAVSPTGKVTASMTFQG